MWWFLEKKTPSLVTSCNTTPPGRFNLVVTAAWSSLGRTCRRRSWSLLHYSETRSVMARPVASPSKTGTPRARTSSSWTTSCRFCVDLCWICPRSFEIARRNLDAASANASSSARGAFARPLRGASPPFDRDVVFEAGRAKDWWLSTHLCAGGCMKD